MPPRKTPLVSGETYHIYNHSNQNIYIFKKRRDCERFIFTLRYYQFKYPPVKLSKFNQQPFEIRSEILASLKKKGEYLVDIVCYCIMPNHFHFTLRQVEKNGISVYLKQLCGSYSHYFNTKHDSFGPLFSGRFKAVRIENEEQLQHVVRYIHLNPLTSHIVKDFKDLLEYDYSSLPEYLKLNNNDTCRKDIIMKDFFNISKYKEFLMNQSDYQRSLKVIKNQMIE
jgi:putative transposase